VLYSGNLSIVHPIDTILEAARRMRDDDNVRFVFVGGGLRSRDIARYRRLYGLANVIELPYQPRTNLASSLDAGDVHLVVMGNQVSGLVHVSKIYGILMAGKPFIAIAPKKSHLVDVIQECRSGFHVDHGNVEGVVQAIQACRAFSKEELRHICETQRMYLEENFTAEKLIASFDTNVLRATAREPQSEAILSRA
jgi:glycosyltransferase involved in cell wall biosynthesis